MKTKIPGAILTALLFIIIGFYVYGFENVYSNLTNLLTNNYPAYYSALMARFVNITTGNLVYLFTALSQMLWRYRGIDMVVQGVFLFSAALSSSVFFREVQRRRK